MPFYCLLITTAPSKTINEVKHDDGDERDDDGERECCIVAPGLHGIVDGDRGGLRLAGNVACDHDGDAEIAERTRKGERRCRQHAAPGKRQRDTKEDAARVEAERARGGFQLRVNALKGRAQTLGDERQRMNRRGDDGSRDGKRQTNAEVSVKETAESGARAEQHQQVVTEHCRRQHERQSDDGINEVTPRKTLACQQPRQTSTGHERNQGRRARHSEREFYRKPVNLASIHDIRNRCARLAFLQDGDDTQGAAAPVFDLHRQSDDDEILDGQLVQIRQILENGDVLVKERAVTLKEG